MRRKTSENVVSLLAAVDGGTMARRARSPMLARRSDASHQLRRRSMDARSIRGLLEWRSLMRQDAAGHRLAGGRSASTAIRLWNPEQFQLRIIREQLQNPSSSQPPSAIMDHLQELRRLRAHKNGPRPLTDAESTRLENLQLEITGLTHHQLSLLQRIWSRVSDKDVLECGRNIFCHLLRSTNTPIHHFFGLVGMSDKEIVNSAIFAQQASNFATVLDYVITSMDDELEKVCLALQSLGEMHSQLAYPIEHQHWALFMRVFEDNPPKLIFQNSEGHRVWKLLITFIFNQLQIGCRIEANDPSAIKCYHGHQPSRNSAFRSYSLSHNNTADLRAENACASRWQPTAGK